MFHQRTLTKFGLFPIKQQLVKRKQFFKGSLEMVAVKPPVFVVTHYNWMILHKTVGILYFKHSDRGLS